MGMLSDEELQQAVSAWTVNDPTPIPTQLVSSDEYLPIAQTARQKQVAARLGAWGDEFGARNGLSRRRFFQTAAGMATAYAAMNDGIMDRIKDATSAAFAQITKLDHEDQGEAADDMAAIMSAIEGASHVGEART